MREIYAELSQRILPLVDDGTIELPSTSGVETSHKKGSRVCYFFCDDTLSDKDQKELITEIGGQLDGLGINWQEN